MENDTSAEDMSSLTCPNDMMGEKERQVKECLENNDNDNNNENCNVIDLGTLRRLASTQDGLVSPELRRMAWPKLVAAHLEIWRTASRPAPKPLKFSRGGADAPNNNDTHKDTESHNTTSRLHHPSKGEIAYIKQVVASCKWESEGILKEDSIVVPQHYTSGQRRPRSLPKSTNSPKEQDGASDNASPESSFPRVERRVSFHIPELEFSTQRQKDRKTLCKVLIHLKRTHPDFPTTSATCSAIAMVLTMVQSSSLSTLVVQQLVSYPWKYCEQCSNGSLSLTVKWNNFFQRFTLNLLKHFQSHGMDTFPWTIRESWIPSWLAQNLSEKQVLARIWDVLILKSSFPDAILYVCIALLSHFQSAILKESNAGNMKLILLNLPSQLKSTEDVEAVLSLALEWMEDDFKVRSPGSPRSVCEKDGSLQDKTNSNGEEVPPEWTTATVAPVDSAIVESARHLRKQLVTAEEGTVLRKAISDNELCFSLQDPNSPFALALKEMPSQVSEDKGDTSEPLAGSDNNSMWPWILVLVIVALALAMAIAVIFEGDCLRSRSILVHQEQSSSSSSLYQALDGYWNAAVDRTCQLWTTTETNYHQDDSNNVAYGPKTSETPEPPRFLNEKKIDFIEEDEIQFEKSESPASASQNIDDTTTGHPHDGIEGMREVANEETEILKDVKEETIDDPPHGAYSESMNQDQTNSETSVTLNEEKGSNLDQESDSEQINQPYLQDANEYLKRSHYDAMRLAKESLSQTQEASKMAESIVSQYLEEATATADRMKTRENDLKREISTNVKEDSAAPATLENAQGFIEHDSASVAEEPGSNVDATSDDHSVATNEGRTHDSNEVVVDTRFDEGESSSSSEDNESSGDTSHSELAGEEITVDGMTEDQSLVSPAMKNPIENYPISIEQDSAPEHVSTSSENESDPVSRDVIDDQVEMEGIAEDDTMSLSLNLDGADDQVMEFLIADSDEIHAVNIVAAEMVGNGEADVLSKNDNEDLWEDKVITEDFEDFGHESLDRHGELSMPEQESGDPIEESKPDKDVMDDVDYSNVSPQITEHNGGETQRPMFEAAQDLLSRYSGFFSQDSQPNAMETLHLSTPFFSKDDLLAVFEQMMASGMDNGMPRKRPKKDVFDNVILI